MPLTIRTNGSGSSNVIGSQWWNDYYDLLTGIMSDQPVSIANSLSLIAGAFNIKNVGGTVLADITSGGQFNPAGTNVVTNGSVGGTITFWSPMWGSGLKICLINELNYNSASTVSFTLPTPNYSFGIIMDGNADNLISVLHSGVAQNIQLITSLGTASANGGSAGTTSMYGNSIGQFATIDTIQFAATSGARSGTTVLIGF